jgi:hypothetical protein
LKFVLLLLGVLAFLDALLDLSRGSETPTLIVNTLDASYKEDRQASTWRPLIVTGQNGPNSRIAREINKRVHLISP